MKTKSFYAIIWVAVSLAIIAGIFITKNANCLWAFFIPAFISAESRNNSEDEKEEKL